MLLVQVSDVDFGAEFFVKPQRTWPPAPSTPPGPGLPARPAGAYFPGLVPHDVGACQDLENKILELKHELKPDRTVLLVTGDLTVWGEPSEFAIAKTFLRSRIRTAWKSAAGLGPVVDEVIAVPGNHDHLRGRAYRTAIRLQPSSGVYPFFPASRSPTPDVWWIHNVIEVGGLRIEVSGLDSCGAKTGQLFAQGQIDLAALQELEKSVAGSTTSVGTPTVRIMLIHHALDQPAPVSPVRAAYQSAHSMDPASRAELSRYCQRTNTLFVLTGHLHAPALPRVQQPQPGTEIRCGTSLQQGSHNKFGQTFLAHLVDDEDDGPRWRTRTFQRCPGRAFVEAQTWRYSTPL